VTERRFAEPTLDVVEARLQMDLDALVPIRTVGQQSVVHRLPTHPVAKSGTRAA
jgi:hypothetical protein